MNYSSYQPIINPSVNDFPANTTPANHMTPLYKEVLDIVKKGGRFGVLAGAIYPKVKTTRHHSRVRLAIDALMSKGLIIEMALDTPKYKLRETKPATKRLDV